MYYTIYKTTNLLNNKIYIGKHQTHNLDDEYLGSGILLLNAINKHGREHFTKEILFIFETEEEMNQKEIEIVNEDFCLREDTYNLVCGGHGGKLVLFPGHPLYEEVKSKISTTQKTRSDKIREHAIKNHKEKKIGMYGKKQSDKQKSITSKVQKGRIRTNEEKNKQKESLKKTFESPGYIHPNSGRKRPDAALLIKKLPRKTCEHCGIETNAGNYGRYHGDKCKRTII